METDSYTNTLASEATFGADMLAHAFLSDTDIAYASPSLSVLSTPQLDFLGTPDTVISHDFGGSSPKMAEDPSFDNFGHDRSIFEDKYLGSGPFFGDATLFASEDVLSSSALLEKYESNYEQKHMATTEVFVDASALSLPPAKAATSALSTAQMTPLSAAAVPAPPSFSRSSSSASFAVPKLPRGRKRKTSTSEARDIVSKKHVGKLCRTSPCAVDDEDDDEKAALRAKNTEAAARSRARKRAAMEAAEQRICELEEENQYLKTLISQKDASLALYAS